MGDRCCRGLNVNVKKVATQKEGQLVMIGIDIWFSAYHFMSLLDINLNVVDNDYQASHFSQQRSISQVLILASINS